MNPEPLVRRILIGRVVLDEGPSDLAMALSEGAPDPGVLPDAA